MKRFILTGPPGSGKTSILHQLQRGGYPVVEEAATDLIAEWQAQGIAEPWKHSGFIDAIAGLQSHRVASASLEPAGVQFHDRSVICTAALADYLGHRRSIALSRELECVTSHQIFEKRVFFIRNLGFIVPTDARRITFEESLRFEEIHESVYRSLGFDLIFIAPGTVTKRTTAILNKII